MLFVPELASRRYDFDDNPNAKVYYTIDGTDPRGPDGSPSETAIHLPTGDSFTVSQNTRIIARSFDDISDRGTEANVVRTDWSGLIEYDVIVSPADVVISELNYHPAPATEAEQALGYSESDFEFIWELSFEI